MGKYLLILALGVGLVIGASRCALAAGLPILLDRGEGDRADVGVRMIIKDGRPLVPASFIQTEIYQRTRVDEKRGQVEMQFALPRFSHGDRKLDRQFFSKTTLALPYQTIDGAHYVDAELAEKILGFTLEKEADAYIVAANRYASFNPRVLDAAPPKSFGSDKISLAWQPTFEEEINLALADKHAGLNVVAPSWFEIVDENGLIKNKADAAYVNKAHEKGYQVWALITNSFDPHLTNRILRSDEARKNVVGQLLAYVKLYSLDGINLDFENVYDADKDALTAFVGEIGEALRAVGATTSIDVTVPSGVSQWSACYDRGALSKAVDYVMVMAYDEHWRTSPVSGSVASIGWVERGLVNTLKEVPAEKLILGVPFYMREWEEDARGGKKINARTMTMEQAERTIREKGLSPVWLEDQGQYYFEYAEGGRRYRVWQEEERSLLLKAALVEKYRLAGIAAWRKGFEKPEIWDALHSALRADASRPEKPARADAQKSHKIDRDDKKRRDH